MTLKKNVDYEQINLFDDLSTQWWNPNGAHKLLHSINNLRLDYIIRCTGSLFKKKVLDVGCGGGILAESMAREGALVTGIDMSSKTLEVARCHAQKSGLKIKYIQSTVEAIALKNETYDVVTCMEVLEHVPNPLSVIKYCSLLTGSQNHIFFSTVNRNVKSWFAMILGLEYILRLLPKGTHMFKKFIKPSELISWADQYSMKSQSIVGIKYNICSNSFILEPTSVDINYILHAVNSSNDK